MRRLLLLPLLLAFPLANGGCIKKMLVDGQIEGTRRASSAFDTIGDYEVARAAAQAGLVQFEGMHKLAPDNEDALFMLTKGWTGFGFGFAEDDYEVAIDAKNEPLADYHMKRAKMAYDRAVFYGTELLGHTKPLTDGDKRDDKSIKAWLQSFDDKDKDAGNLFWVGYAWMARVNLMKGDFELGTPLLAELFIGVAMIERSVELDPTYNHYAGTVALAAYNARASIADPPAGKKLFDLALERTQRKALIVQYNYATKYACTVSDKPLYEKMLNEVIAAEDPDPEQRLTNAIAKRRARRAFGERRMQECNVWESAPSNATQAPPAAPAPASSAAVSK
jgi:hypothetical protein